MGPGRVRPAGRGHAAHAGLRALRASRRRAPRGGDFTRSRPAAGALVECRLPARARPAAAARGPDVEPCRAASRILLSVLWAGSAVGRRRPRAVAARDLRRRPGRAAPRLPLEIRPPRRGRYVLPGARCAPRIRWASSDGRGGSPDQVAPRLSALLPMDALRHPAGTPLSAGRHPAVLQHRGRHRVRGDAGLSPGRSRAQHPLALLGPARPARGEGVPGGVLLPDRDRPRHVPARRPRPRTRALRGRRSRWWRHRGLLQPQRVRGRHPGRGPGHLRGERRAQPRLSREHPGRARLPGAVYAPPFQTIGPPLFEKLAQITTVVAVLQDWDAAREAFLRQVRASGVAVRAIVVHEGATRLPWSEASNELGEILRALP